MAAANSYETTTITGQATAVLGNKYGDIFNIQQATFLLSSTTVPSTNDASKKVVRQNQLQAGEEVTKETITTYNHGPIVISRGSSTQVELVWTKQEDIGVGVFGEVHREETTEAGMVKSRAVKVLRRKQLEYMQIDYRKELDALIQLSQPAFVHRFVEFYAWYEYGDKICLAMEFVPHRDLDSFIRAGLDENDTRQIAYQILDGLSVMHRLGLVHRDIKPANIFVIQKQPEWWVKIGDFSISKSTITRQTNLRTQVGTQVYQAPEVLGLIPTKKADMYDLKCDIWSFGCLIFEALTKQLPFPHVGMLTSYCQEDFSFPGREIQKVGSTFLIAEFIWYMLQADPEHRPNAEQALFLLTYRSDREAKADSMHVLLKDGKNRIFRLPWVMCSTWAAMQSVVRLAASYVSSRDIGKHVKEGQFCFQTEELKILNGTNWHILAQPGMKLFLKTFAHDSGKLIDIKTLDSAACQDHTVCQPRPDQEASGDQSLASMSLGVVDSESQDLDDANFAQKAAESSIPSQASSSDTDANIINEQLPTLTPQTELETLASEVGTGFKKTLTIDGTIVEGSIADRRYQIDQELTEVIVRPEAFKSTPCHIPHVEPPPATTFGNTAKTQGLQKSVFVSEEIDTNQLLASDDVSSFWHDDQYYDTNFRNVSRVDSVGKRSPKTIEDDEVLITSQQTGDAEQMARSSVDDCSVHQGTDFNIFDILSTEIHSDDHSKETQGVCSSRSAAEETTQEDWQSKVMNDLHVESSDEEVDPDVVFSLADFDGGVHALSYSAFRNFENLRDYLLTHHALARWTRYIERGFFCLLSREGHEIRPKDWASSILPGVDVELALWAENADASPWCPWRIGDTNLLDYPLTAPSAISITDPMSGVDTAGFIVFHDCHGGFGYAGRSIWQSWKCMLDYIRSECEEGLNEIGHTDLIANQRFDLFVLELGHRVDEYNWYVLRRGMHVYMLVWPWCDSRLLDLYTINYDVLERTIAESVKYNDRSDSSDTDGDEYHDKWQDRYNVAAWYISTANIERSRNPPAIDAYTVKARLDTIEEEDSGSDAAQGVISEPLSRSESPSQETSCSEPEPEPLQAAGEGQNKALVDYRLFTYDPWRRTMLLKTWRLDLRTGSIVNT